MKTAIFVRGIDTDYKRILVDELMKLLNPDVNTVRAIKISMNDSNHNDRKAASSDCKNKFRNLISGTHGEKFIVINNETLRPSDWESYKSISKQVKVPVQWVGIDIWPHENINITDFSRKINLQTENLSKFKLTLAKYSSVNILDDIKKFVADITHE